MWRTMAVAGVHCSGTSRRIRGSGEHHAHGFDRCTDAIGDLERMERASRGQRHKVLLAAALGSGPHLAKAR